MLKPLTLSITLALALGASTVSFAGMFGHGEAPCTTCGLASPQGPVVASAQSVVATGGCETAAPCAKKKCDLGLGKLMAKLHQPKVYTYEWVLKKKKVKHTSSCGGCDTCAPAASVYPSAQYASPQGGSVAPSYQAAPSGQSAPSYQAAPSGQAYPTGQIKTGYIAPATGDVPPPPAVTASPLFLSPAGN